MRLLPPFIALSLVVLAACGSPTPTCAATDTPYQICSDGSVYECPQATQDKLDAKKAIDDACRREADSTKCILNAKYEMFPMTLKARCREGGQKCVESSRAADGGVSGAFTPKSASCQP